MTGYWLYFIYGLCVMFYGMMAWFFLHKNRELLSRLVAALMIVVCCQCVKDLFFMQGGSDESDYLWMCMTSTDMVAVPLYAFILIELCRPGTLTARTMVAHELPFVVLPVLFMSTGNLAFYYADVAWASVYGLYYAVWTVFAIPAYHRRLRQRFSYEENINLNWLRVILFSFFAILSLWIVDCIIIDFAVEAVYLLGSLVIWTFICYFIYRHESVIDELAEPAAPAETAVEETEEDCATVELRERIRRLFEEEHIYLNPQLKLSDVAAMTNSNRTYISRVFNNGHGKTFFEFVNHYRVARAKELLCASGAHIEEVAEQSGFNSRQSFHRVFSKLAGCTPDQFRSQRHG